jgi:hypothetical protein
MRVRVVHLLPVALALLFAGCSYGTLAPVRFTYVVKYSVATSAATVSPISYMDATSALVPEPAPTAVWSLELAPMTYDYASPFYPQLVATGAALAAGESATVTISWKDYRTGFAADRHRRRRRRHSPGHHSLRPRTASDPLGGVRRAELDACFAIH